MTRTVFERSTGDVEIVRLPIAQCEASTRVLSADQMWSPTDGPNAGKHKLGNDVDVFADLAYIEDGGGGGSAAWGDITGTLADQTDLAAALAAKVTTVGWTSQYGMSANTSGTTSVLIQPVGTESIIKTIAQIGHGLTLGQPVRMNGGAYVAAQGNSAANAAYVGFVLEVVSANQFRLLTAGHSAGAPAAMFSGLTAGTAAYLSPSSAGALTNTPNAFGPVLMPTSATAGYVLSNATAVNSPKLYKALIAQSGTNAPVPIVIVNTLGTSPTFSYLGVGQYEITGAGLFPLAKCVTLLSQPVDPNNGWEAQIAASSTDLVQIFTYNGGIPSDDAMPSGQTIIIEAYP